MMNVLKVSALLIGLLVLGIMMYSSATYTPRQRLSPEAAQHVRDMRTILTEKCMLNRKYDDEIC